MSTNRNFCSRLLTGLLLSAIMLCIGCEKQQAAASGKSQQNARWRAEVIVPYRFDIQMYEVVIDGEHYIVAAGNQCVTVVPKTKQAQLAERQ